MTAGREDDGASEAAQGAIVVSGTGRVSVEPDLAEVRLGVSLARPTVAEARDEAARTMTAILEAVGGAGVDRRDVRTALLSVQPRYDYRDGGPPVLVGYELVNAITVLVRDLARLGEVVDGALRAGATSMDGLSFRVAEAAAAEREARVRAMREARARAEVLAEAGGLAIAGVRDIVEGVPVRPPTPYAKAERMALAASDVPTPTETGSVEVEVTVTVTFSVR